MRRYVLLLSLLLSACGTAIPKGPKAATDTSENGPFYVVSFNPPGGEVAELPDAITILFNEIPFRPTLSPVTHYNFNCGGDTYAASAVDTVNGFSSVTITVPSIPNLSAGTACDVAVSSKILDANGNALGGTRIATYTLTQ